MRAMKRSRKLFIIPLTIGLAVGLGLIGTGFYFFRLSAEFSSQHTYFDLPSLLGLGAVAVGAVIVVGVVIFVFIWLFLKPYEPSEPEWRKIRPEGESPNQLEEWMRGEEVRQDQEEARRDRSSARDRLRTSWIIAGVILFISFAKLGFLMGMPIVLAYIAWSSYWGWVSLKSQPVGKAIPGDTTPILDDAITFAALLSATVYGVFGGGIEQYRHLSQLAAEAEQEEGP